MAEAGEGVVVVVVVGAKPVPLASLLSPSWWLRSYQVTRVTGLNLSTTWLAKAVSNASD